MTVDVECLAPWDHYIAKPIWRSDSCTHWLATRAAA